jgi:hypothetical protein
VGAGPAAMVVGVRLVGEGSSRWDGLSLPAPGAGVERGWNVNALTSERMNRWPSWR